MSIAIHSPAYSTLVIQVSATDVGFRFCASVLAGGDRTEVPVYDTEVGWLHLPIDELVEGTAAAVAGGVKGVKIKIGKPSPAEDAERLAAVRAAIGPHRDLMVDANQAFSL